MHAKLYEPYIKGIQVKMIHNQIITSEYRFIYKSLDSYSNH